MLKKRERFTVPVWRWWIVQVLNLFPVCLLSPCARKLYSSHRLKLILSDSLLLLLNTPSFSPLSASPSPFFSFKLCLFSLLASFSVSTGPPTSHRRAFIFLCVEFLWEMCVCNAVWGSTCARVRHINMLCSSRRQACACCSMCLCNLLSVFHNFKS